MAYVCKPVFWKCGSRGPEPEPVGVVLHCFFLRVDTS